MQLCVAFFFFSARQLPLSYFQLNNTLAVTCVYSHLFMVKDWISFLHKVPCELFQVCDPAATVWTGLQQLAIPRCICAP